MLKRLALVTALVTGCAPLNGIMPGAKNDYPAATVQTFMNACTANGASAADCACMLSEIQTKMTHDDFSKAELQSRFSGQFDPKTAEIMAAAALACRSK